MATRETEPETPDGVPQPAAATQAESSDVEEAEPEKSTRKSMKQRLEDLIAEYGFVAFAIFFGIFLIVYSGFFIAIKAGIDVGSSTGESAGTFFAAWVATKITWPLRVLGTLVLTPIVGRFVHRKRHPDES